MNTIRPVVYYNDGTKIELGKQADGSLFGYNNIDREKLSAFALVQDGKELLKLHIEEGQRLIWRKREYIAIGKDKKVIHLLGWRKSVGYKDVQAIAYVFDDGHIELAGAFRKDHPIFDEVKLTEQENGLA